ncbi:MAG: hypothetical protein QUT30_05835 [Acidobacteriota bacterium]|nr:hypothetical protein [Acidobacteriota bacterium]
MEMPKYPWMQFNTGDWLKDPKLSMCQPATRGIWIDAIAAMHENGRCGSLSGTPDQLIRVLRCTVPALMSAIMDLQSTGAADVEQRNGVVTLINRRMSREAKEREMSRIRQERFREMAGRNAKNNGPVTEMSQPTGIYISNSFSNSFEKKKESEEKEKLVERFDVFWAAYPRKEAKQNAWKEFQRLNPDEELMSVMIPWIGLACDSEQWQDKSKIPHPATWLHQRRWEGDPPPKPREGGKNGTSSANSARSPGGAPKFDPADIPEYARPEWARKPEVPDL